MVWSPLLTTCTSAAVVLLCAELASPSYEAVMECDPTDRLPVVKVALPLLSSARLARVLPPSKNVTLPVGVGAPPLTVAVMVTAPLNCDGLGVEASVVV